MLPRLCSSNDPATAFVSTLMAFKNRKRAAVRLLLAAALLIGASYWVLFSRIGIFLVGHRLWIGAAARTTNTEAARYCVLKVISSTQYGVNLAQTRVKALSSATQRVRLLRLLITLAPNENWRTIYSRDLYEENQRTVGGTGNGAAQIQLPSATPKRTG